MKQGSKELTLRQSNASKAIHVFQHLGQLTFCKLLCLNGRKHDANQEQRHKGHHFGCPQEPEMGAPHSFTSFYLWRKPQGPWHQALHPGRRWRETGHANTETLSLPNFLPYFYPVFPTPPLISSPYKYCFLPRVSNMNLFPFGFFVLLFLVDLFLGSRMSPAYFRNKGGLRDNMSEAIRK